MHYTFTTNDTAWLDALVANNWRRVNPHSFLNDFDKWWAFELRRRGL